MRSNWVGEIALKDEKWVAKNGYLFAGFDARFGLF
jgi:hypothetical protein